MSILERLRVRLDALAAAGLPLLAGGDDRLSFSADVPAGRFGSLLKLDVSVLSEAHGDGERVRVRAHVRSNFASVLKPMLAAAPGAPSAYLPAATTPGGSGASGALQPASRVGAVASRGLRRALASRLVQRLATPLLRHDVNTWIEITASSASLDRGAQDLIPHNDKLAALGIRPTAHDGAHVENWSGATPAGMAQVSMLQIGKKDLPPGLARRLGDQPFNLAAVVVSTVEEPLPNT